MKKGLLWICIICLLANVNAQFAGPAGSPNTTAIPADSNIFVAWASKCDLQRGWLDIRKRGNMKATLGLAKDALGKAEGYVVSLGDSGIATLQFLKPIYNGPSWDFAVFENSFSDNFLELAFVEVSSNGKDFVRFLATCNQSDTMQNGPFDLTSRPDLYNNLAGKYRGGFGTPFDLNELKDSSGLNINQITHVRIIDVVGSVSDSFASYDMNGNPINDPFPTPFSSCGFDLDAVGVIHSTASNKNISTSPAYWPNPANNIINIEKGFDGIVELVNPMGQVVLRSSKNIIDVSELAQGLYSLRFTKNGISSSSLLIISR